MQTHDAMMVFSGFIACGPSLLTWQNLDKLEFEFRCEIKLDKQTYYQDKQMRLDLNYFHRIFNMGCFDGVIENNWVRSANSHPPWPGTVRSNWTLALIISMGCYLSVIDNHWFWSANSPPPPPLLLLVIVLPVFSTEYSSTFTYCSEHGLLSKRNWKSFARVC